MYPFHETDESAEKGIEWSKAKTQELFVVSVA